ncbi:MAG: hypothetical protein ACRD12_19635 [Acidimicrobiales bacterium]
MAWFDLFARGARRLTDRTTYVVLLLGVVVGGAPPLLLSLLIRDNSDAGAVLAMWIISTIWAWLTITFVWGALSVAAVERPSESTPAAVLGLTARLFGSFLAVTCILAAASLVVLFGLVVLSLPGKGGTSTAPIEAVLTPILLVVGGLGVLTLLIMLRLSFAIVAVDSAPSARAVGRAWRLLRRRTSDILLYIATDTVVVVGVVLGVLLPVLYGAAWAMGIEASFFVQGQLDDFYNGVLTGDFSGSNLKFGALGAFLFACVLLMFVMIAVGAVGSFSLGSSVGFYLMTTDGAGGVVSERRELRVARFCDGCGVPATTGAQFCDSCGLELVLA